jgi:pyruvate,water dikinase
VSYIVRFRADGSDDHGLVGGKAASLGRLARAEFPVPAGFTVSTRAHESFLQAGRLNEQIAEILGSIDFGDATAIDTQTARIRALITDSPMPDEVVAAIAADYRALGDDPYVAVRSSGTAEDLADASFAGMHDTYLDVRGEQDVLDAVRRCWASMWTARATAYRHNGKHDQEAARLAVVVQTMVESDVSGVMFTANPMTARTDEIVVNASWGLGEGIVSGVLTPDEYLLAKGNLKIKARTVGAKEKQVRRNPETSRGTVLVDTPQQDRDRSSLSDEHLVELADLGRRVMDFYGGLPQDIEWALVGEQLHLLQSRPVTGAEFTWDEEVDGWYDVPEDDDTIWTFTWAEQFLTGGITPLFYSCRAWECVANWSRFAKLYGFDEITNVRWFKYRRATAYYNCEAERIWQKGQWPSPLRDLTNIPPAWQAEFAKEQTSVAQALKVIARVELMDPKFGVRKWADTVYEWIDNKVELANGPSQDELRRLSDEELKRQCEKGVSLVDQFFETLWPPFFWLAGPTFGGLALMLQKWYDGDNANVFQDLISGVADTLLAAETKDMWRTAQDIVESPKLRALLDDHPGAEFFEKCRDSDEGRAFLEKYQEFLANHGHRGHQDRDIYYKRRSEDPSLDYYAFRAVLAAGDRTNPADIERQMIAKREAATEEVVANLRRKAFGGIKADVFRMLMDYTHKLLKFRDDERHYLDRITMQKKNSFAELGRRMFERGLLEEEDEFYFLARHELYALAEGRAQIPLAKAKIAGRKRVFHRRNARQENTPPYIQHGVPIDLDLEGASDGQSGDVLRGAGLSRGTSTGTVRIVPDLGQIGKVQDGDILVCNATDPGWMSVFPLIRGLVLETGGMLAHGACLSREYGIPAVQLRNAIQLIEDGSSVVIDGDAGEIRLAEPVEPVAEEQFA